MVKQILENFNIEGNLANVETNTTGNINNTYIATFKNADGTKKYLIQKINTKVFTEPYKLMKNVEGVTSYLKNQLLK